MSPIFQFCFGIFFILFGCLGYIFESGVRSKWLRWGEIDSYPKFKIFTAISVGILVAGEAVMRIFW